MTALIGLPELKAHIQETNKESKRYASRLQRIYVKIFNHMLALERECAAWKEQAEIYKTKMIEAQDQVLSRS